MIFWAMGLAIVEGLRAPRVRVLRRARVSMVDCLILEIAESEVKAGPACRCRCIG